MYVTLCSDCYVRHAVSDTFMEIFLDLVVPIRHDQIILLFRDRLCFSMCSIDTSLPSINKTMTMTDAYGNVEVFAEGGLEHYIAHVSYNCNSI